MSGSVPAIDRRIACAIAGAAVIGAQFIAGKAARDALFLAQFEPTVLPRMIIGTSIFSIVLVTASSRSLGRVAPGTYVPIAFIVSALLLMLEWGLSYVAPQVAAPVLYLQISGIGPLLGSGFWLIASEQFDPRSAKRRFGQIAAAGTIGGLLGGLVAARISAAAGVATLLPMLAALNLFCAWLARILSSGAGHIAHQAAPSAMPTRSGVRVLADTPYLRNLALLVLFGTVAAAFVDYVFKVQVKTAFAGSAGLGSFFSFYYAAVSLATFGIQTFASHAVLQRFGLTAAMSAPSFSLLIGVSSALLVPGFRAMVGTRASEAVLRGSLLKSGYELFYTPVSADDKRAVKGVIDVGVDRTGDIIGFGVIQLLLWAPPANLPTVLLWLALGAALATVIVGSRLSRGYVAALEKSLLERRVDLAEMHDPQTRTILLNTLRRTHLRSTADARVKSMVSGLAPFSTDLEAIASLQSDDVATVRAVLNRTTGLPAGLIPYAIPLLEHDALAADVILALRAVAERRVGALSDALLDADTPFVVRRRLARVFSTCYSQRAIDTLLYSLDDLRFEVRYHCARSLAAIHPHVAGARIDATRVMEVVRREVAVSTRAWQGRQVLDQAMGDDQRSPVDLLVADRASRALEHVFTLLGLVLSAEALQVAYRGLHTTDKSLRGTALEYLDSVLPADIRDHLWPFIDADAGRRPSTRPPEDVLGDLLQSHQSILVSLQRDHRGTGV